MKLQENPNGQIFLYLPKDMVEAVGFKKGDNLNVFQGKGNEIVIKKAMLIDVKTEE